MSQKVRLSSAMVALIQIEQPSSTVKLELVSPALVTANLFVCHNGIEIEILYFLREFVVIADAIETDLDT